MKRSLIEVATTGIIGAYAALTLGGLETLSKYMLDYLLRAYLAYQGY